MQINMRSAHRTVRIVSRGLKNNYFSICVSNEKYPFVNCVTGCQPNDRLHPEGNTILWHSNGTAKEIWLCWQNHHCQTTSKWQNDNKSIAIMLRFVSCDFSQSIWMCVSSFRDWWNRDIIGIKEYSCFDFVFISRTFIMHSVERMSTSKEIIV